MEEAAAWSQSCPPSSPPWRFQPGHFLGSLPSLLLFRDALGKGPVRSVITAVGHETVVLQPLAL